MKSVGRSSVPHIFLEAIHGVFTPKLRAMSLILILLAACAPASAASKYYNPDLPLTEAKQDYDARKAIFKKGLEAHNRALAYQEKVLKAKRTFLDERETYLKSIRTKFFKAKKSDEKKYRDELGSLLSWQHARFSAQERDRHLKLEEQARQIVDRYASELRGRLASYNDELTSYTRLFVDRGPRYLKQVTIKINDEIYYLGRYDPVPDAANNPAFDIGKMRDELASIYATVREREQQRLEAVKELKTLHLKISNFSDDYQSAIWNSALYPVLFDVGAVVIEAVVTGGGSVAVHGATKLAGEVKAGPAFKAAIREVSNTAAPLRRKVVSTGKNVAGKSKTPKKSYFSPGSGELTDASKRVAGEAANKLAFYQFGELKANETLTDLALGPKQSAAKKAFYSSLTADALEQLITNAPAALKDFGILHQAPATGVWTAIEAGKKPIAGKVRFNNLKEAFSPKGLGLTAVTSVLKAVLVAELAKDLDDSKRRFFGLVAQSGYYVQMLDVHRSVDREIEVIRKQYEAAIQDYEFRQRILDRNTRLELQRTADRVFKDHKSESALDAFVDVEIDLRFSQPIEHAPSLVFAGMPAGQFERLEGKHRSAAWRTTLGLNKSFFRKALAAGFETLPLEVSIDKRENYTALDARPETLALPKVFEEDWRLYEAGVDRNHRLKLKEIVDLSGRWIITGGSASSYFDVYASTYTFRITQKDDRIEIRYDTIPDVLQAFCKHPANKTLRCIEEGQLFLTATMEKSRTRRGNLTFRGEAYVGKRVKACDAESGTPVGLIVSQDEEAIAGWLQSAFDISAYSKPLTTCPVKGSKKPVDLQALNPGGARFTLVRRGTPYAESILKRWQILYSGLKGNPSRAAAGFAPGFSFFGTGVRNEIQSVGGGLSIEVPRFVATPNDGSVNDFWEVESFSDVAAAENISLELNVEEGIRAQKYADGELTGEIGFAPTNLDISNQGVKGFLGSLGVNNRQDLKNLAGPPDRQAKGGRPQSNSAPVVIQPFKPEIKPLEAFDQNPD